MVAEWETQTVKGRLESWLVFNCLISVTRFLVVLEKTFSDYHVIPPTPHCL